MRAQRAPRRDVASCVGVGNERLRSRPSRAIVENDRRAWVELMQCRIAMVWAGCGESPGGVMVREGGGTPFRQIFWSRNGAPANIVGHRWNANTEAFRQIR